MLTIGGEFIICVALIIASGTKLCTFGDVIAKRTGLGRTWVGVLLIAAVTSLPELITTASCASLVNVPDMAVGIIFGSCVFNLMIIVLLDIFQGPEPIFLRAHHRHIQTILLSIFLSGLAMFAIFIKEPIHFWGIGLTSIFIVIFYLVGMRKILKAEQKEHESHNDLNNSAWQKKQYDKVSFGKAVKGFALSAVVIIFASVWISFVGEKIAIATGMKGNFVGNVFLALATSLPEVVVSIAALKIGAINLALGNLFGSNAFNILILPVTDIFYRKGALLANVTSLHLDVGFLGILLSVVAIVGIYFQPRKSICRLGWDVASMFFICLIGIWILFMKG